MGIYDRDYLRNDKGQRPALEGAAGPAAGGGFAFRGHAIDVRGRRVPATWALLAAVIGTSVVLILLGEGGAVAMRAQVDLYSIDRGRFSAWMLLGPFIGATQLADAAALILSLVGLTIAGKTVELALKRGARLALLGFAAGSIAAVLAQAGMLELGVAQLGIVGPTGGMLALVGMALAIAPGRPVFVWSDRWSIPLGWVMAMLLVVLIMPSALGSVDTVRAGELVAGLLGVGLGLALRSGVGWSEGRGTDAITHQAGASQAAGEAAQAGVDRVLDKVSREGIDSLSARERQVLEDASAR